MAENYLNPKVRISNTDSKGRGLFAEEKIMKGEIIEETADVQIISKKELATMPKEWRQLCYEINDREEICPKDINNPPAGFLINHSCDPNCGSTPDVFTTVAMKDIEKGEELTYDYAMTDSGNFEMECYCRAVNCRKIIKGTDWMIPDLQKRYAGYFQKNIQEKIDVQKTLPL